MKVAAATPELIVEALMSIDDMYRKVADDLHKLQQELDLEIEMRVVRQKAKTTYHITYYTKKPKRLLFISKFNDCGIGTFAVRANLNNIDKYIQLFLSSSETIIESTKNVSQCNKCNAKCFMDKGSYMLDGVFYDPCCKRGFRFEKLNSSDWEQLKELIKHEHQAFSEIAKKII